MTTNLFLHYKNYKEQKLSTLKIKHNEVEQIILQLNKKKFDISEIGKSFEDRKIYQIKIGTGQTKILLWSQMHGNEAVGTMTIFDILNFLIYKDEFNTLRKSLLENCTFYFIPMLNPDGAEKFTRRNAQEIDLNRDAIKAVAPESKILIKIVEELKPDFGFNLHDQEIYYKPEESEKTSALSFLAPAFDINKNIDSKRQKSMLIIADLFSMLQKHIPNQIAKYNDSFMPNAFGDNIQKKGTSTILVEAGYIYGDNNRQEIRKYYFLSLIYAFASITNKNYEKFTTKEYFAIPMNIKMIFCDFIFKNITIQKNNKQYSTDIAVIRNPINTEQFTDFVEEYIIWDIGDLENKKAFQIIDSSKIKINNDKNIVKILKKADFLLKYTL